MLFFAFFWNVASQRMKVFHHQYVLGIPKLVSELTFLRLTVIKSPPNTLKFLKEK